MEREPTLGERLAARAAALRGRRAAVPGWSAALTPVLERLRALPDPERSPRLRAEVRVPPPGWERPEFTWPLTHPAPSPAPAHAGEGPAPVAGGPGEPIRGDLRERLAPDYEVARVRVHHDEHADQVAQAHGADAVTVGQDVYFRAGRFRPDEPEGFALLAHEVWHATEPGRTGGAAHRATAWGAAREERAALAHERTLLPDGLPSFATAPPAPKAPAVPTAPAASQAPAAIAARPMAARQDRHQETPAQALDPGALRQVIREVLRGELRDEASRQLRADLAIELERGA
ncbi:DUF4157 domain-containing protein [Nonomuraea sp. NPDC046802]|uniref:eCIS core domain-containing protein n=1 Tax=Nonomuraea sp. NPDC046802 TaxID=3154919 RepID=UPI0033C4870C